jgi:hypothetical protein
MRLWPGRAVAANLEMQPKVRSLCGICLGGTMSLFMILFMILAALWLLCFFAFHVTSGLIHILLGLAVIALIVHFLRGRQNI